VETVVSGLLNLVGRARFKNKLHSFTNYSVFYQKLSKQKIHTVGGWLLATEHSGKTINNTIDGV